MTDKLIKLKLENYEKLSVQYQEMRSNWEAAENKFAKSQEKCMDLLGRILDLEREIGNLKTSHAGLESELRSKEC